MHLMSSNSDRARMVGSNFDRVRIVVVGDAGITCTGVSGVMANCCCCDCVIERVVVPY